MYIIFQNYFFNIFVRKLPVNESQNESEEYNISSGGLFYLYDHENYTDEELAG